MFGRHNFSTLDRLCNSNFLAEPFERISSLDFFKLNWCELVKELVYAKVTTTDADLNLVLLHAHVYTFSAELVDTLTVPHKHHLQLVAVGVVVDELSYLLVNRVSLDRNIDRHPHLEIDDVALEGGSLELKVSDPVEQAKTDSVCLKSALF